MLVGVLENRNTNFSGMETAITDTGNIPLACSRIYSAKTHASEKGKKCR
jgi:hypothetical protein